MNRARYAQSERNSALVVNYAFDINVLTGLREKHLREVSNLLRVHADRSQLKRLRSEIDSILRQEHELDRQVSNQVDIKRIEELLPSELLIGFDPATSGGANARRSKRCGPARSLDKLVDQLHALLGRVNERRRPSVSVGAE